MADYAATGQDYLLANGEGFDDGWASRRMDIMDRASVNAELKNSDKLERRLECQQEEFLGCLKQHEADKIILGKYLKELEEKNSTLEGERDAALAELDAVQQKTDNYRLAIDEMKDESESVLKYWKHDQQKLAKLVGPDYDTMDIAQVRLMDLSAVESMASEANAKLGEGNPAGLSTFQKRMQARTQSLQDQLANEKGVMYRLNHDGTLQKDEVAAVATTSAADPDQTQCYWSPLDGCYHVLGEEEKALAAQAGATVNTAVLSQETAEVRDLQRRISELEFAATISGSSVEELDRLQDVAAAATAEVERQKQRTAAAENMSAQTRLQLESLKASGASGSAGPEVASMSTQISKLASELDASAEEKSRLKLQHEKEKEMFMNIAEKLSNEVDETKKALSAVFESYPHLKSVVQGQTS